MDEECFKSAERLIPRTYLQQAADVKKTIDSKLKILIEQRKCPENGWDDHTIELALHNISMMDSNNFPHNAGVGEREARIFSDLVSRRHYRLCHGIGRSGDLAEVQPKAAGSSLIYQLTNSITLDLLRATGVPNATSCLVVPVATGMALMITLLAIRKERPKATHVIWSRIDQKSCLKAILTAGYSIIVVDGILEGDELRTNVAKMEEELSVWGDSIAAVVTTTSCFAPRGMDKLEEVGKLCKERDVPHIVNNAYGVQSSKCMHHIQMSHKVGRVDAFIQSTDKNFMVPVGGSIIAGFDENFIKEIGKSYPGRASSGPIVDLFMTLLSMGKVGYKQLLKERKELYDYLKSKMEDTAREHGFQVLQTKNNPISIAMTLSKHPSITNLGSMLFLRGVSGTRVVSCKDQKTIGGISFEGWGSHSNNYPSPYLTAAASIGMTTRDVDVFITRLNKCLKKFHENINKE